MKLFKCLPDSSEPRYGEEYVHFARQDEAMPLFPESYWQRWNDRNGRRDVKV